MVRILIFVVYIALISKMQDIKTVFQYHGAEHKTIHCFENGLELTPENAQTFYTLHPRCGTSFLMFVMVVAIIVHAFMGWPNVWLRMRPDCSSCRSSQVFPTNCSNGQAGVLTLSLKFSACRDCICRS